MPTTLGAAADVLSLAAIGSEGGDGMHRVLEVPRLRTGDVHIWLACIDLTARRIQALVELLTPDEIDRMERFRFPRDRDRFVAARGLLRSCLACYCDTHPGRLRFRYGTRGKPAVDAGSDEGIRFSVSHADGIALYAVAGDGQVGVDLEPCRPHPMDASVARRYFSQREYATLSQLPPAMRPDAFIRCWTRREACLKAQGEGLSSPPQEIDASILGGAPMAVGRSEGIEVIPWRCDRWRVRDLDVDPDYLAAVAVHGAARRLSFFAWPPTDRNANGF